jgi:D-arabinose 1-dehydrogenase-like Zn-dependent alcohol dehydrogenase
VTTAKEGDAVLVYPPYSCGLCVSCRRGLDMFCERHQFYGLTKDGGFADYLLVDERSLVPLPAGVEPAAVAPHSDAGITAYHAVKKLLPRLAPGTTSVVIGVGGVGHIALQLLRALGGGAVIGVDTDARRRMLAKEFGADEVLTDAAGVRERRTAPARTSFSTWSRAMRPMPPGWRCSPAGASTRRSATAA